MANVVISKPEVTTYWISYGPIGSWYGFVFGNRGELKHYGEVSPTQVMETKWVEVDQYTSREEWKTVLLSKGIDPDDEME